MDHSKNKKNIWKSIFIRIVTQFWSGPLDFFETKLKIVLDDDAPLTDVVNTKEKTDDKENFESAEMWIEVDGTVKEWILIKLFYSIVL